MDLVDVKSRGDVKFKVISFRNKSGGVRTTIAKHHRRYLKSDHLCQDGVE